MKKFLFLLIAFFLLVSKNSKAQYVTIPDGYFAGFIDALCPGAMVGNNLDTTNTCVINTTTINMPPIWGNFITNLYGIQFFDNLTNLNYTGANQLSNVSSLPPNLQVLTITNSLLTSLPSLPNSLHELHCNNNQLTSLPSLPSNLIQLDCDNNQLAQLPALPNSLMGINTNSNLLSTLPTLPSSIVSIFANNNQLNSLPPLPANINVLDLSFNLLSTLPITPNSLEILFINDNLFTQMPIISNTVKELYISNNNIANLPNLPDSITIFVCSGNLLGSLPTLPTKLTEIDCSNNFLTHLPVLPINLQWLICDSNQLIDIPPLPDNITSFSCVNNNLYCLPIFSDTTFEYFYAYEGNNLSCIPAPINATFTDSTVYLPICTILSGCPVLSSISGAVHEKNNSNCLLDSMFFNTYLANIKVLKKKGNIVLAQKYIPAHRNYFFRAAIGDTLNITVDTTNCPFIVSCPTSTYRNVTITPTDSIFDRQNFSIECKPGIDLGVQSINASFRINTVRIANIFVGDISKQYLLNCASGVSGTVTTIITGNASYNSAAVGAIVPTSVNGNTINYTISDFGALNFNNAFDINILVNANATLGSSICIKTIVHTNNDINSINDTLEYCGMVVNSIDPNEKNSYPINTTSPNSWITYTINFQNTGTDTAYHIFIRDTIDNNLLPESFTFLASSHTPQISIDSNNILFNFPHINLLDSMHNEPQSHGWIQYKLKTKSNLPINTAVKNKAYIYFDNNSPVITNTALNIYGTTGVSSINKSSAIRIYPNPAKNNISFQANERGEIRICDITGAVLKSINYDKNNAPQAIDVSTYSRGVYLLQYISIHGIRKSEKLLIE